jgi:hypothetical protein
MDYLYLYSTALRHHRSLHTTMIYLHLTTASQEQAVARIETLMGT